MRVLLTLCMFGVFLLIGCSNLGTATPPASAQNPPLFPEAQAVQTQTIPGDKPKPTKVITFETSAHPGAIMAYYRDALIRDGWGVENSTTKSNVHYYWVAGCPVFGITVSTTPSSDG